MELEEAKWRALSGVVVQRLKRLMAGAADPASVKRDNEVRRQQADLAAKQKAAKHRLRHIEKQR